MGDSHRSHEPGGGREPARTTAAAGDRADGGPLGEPIRVLIVDDHALFRQGLRTVVEGEPDMEVVAEADDGSQAVTHAGDLLPDVVFMDIRMPRQSGIDACMAVKEVAPSARIVMLTVSDEESDLYQAIKAGASGYLLKHLSLTEVPGAVRAVHGGQSLINPSMASTLLDEFASMSSGASQHQQEVPTPRLTSREMEVLRLVATGLNNRDIAKQLFISENTVKNHVRNILEKLQLHSRMEAVVYAVRERFLEIS